MTESTIQAVFFDLDGTLRYNRPNGFESFVAYLNEGGQVLSAEQVLAGQRWTHYYWSVAPERNADLREFGEDRHGFWLRHTERQLRAVGIERDVPELAAQIGQLFDQRYQPVLHVPDDVLPTLARLRTLGYKVGLVSNRLEPLETLVAEMGLADYFLFTLSAGQAGTWKPDAAIFLKAVALAGCEAEATAYVGDNYYADVEGAIAAGLRPILLDPDGIFPEAACPVIRTLGELEGTLAKMEPA